MSKNQAPTEEAAKAIAEFDRVPLTLSIQSHMSCDHVGNSAAVLPLQHAGFEMWPVRTVDLPSHTSYDQWRGPVTPATDVHEVIKGIDELGKLDGVDVITSGYQGGSDIADAVIEAMALIKQRNPKAIYSCDPVMRSAKSGRHVSSDIPPLLRGKVVPVADMITPNRFELGYLTDREVGDLESTSAAAHTVREIGPEAVLVTSVLRPERKVGKVEVLAVGDSGTWLVATPYLSLKHNGSDDVTAVLFAGNPLHGRDINGSLSVALGNTAANIFELFKVTHESGSGELRLVRVQKTYVHPEQRFEATKVA